MKIRCPEGNEHTIEESRQCKECKKVFPEPILHSLLYGRDREKKPREKPAYGVGTLVDPCLRHSYYKLTEPEVLDLDKLWIFSRGHAIHEFITKALGDEHKEIFVKTSFPAFDIIGFIDAKHANVLYEFKTTGNIPELPQKHHVLQAQAYFSMLEESDRANINKILIVYLSLNNVKIFEVPKANIISFIEGKAAVLTKALRDKMPLKREVSWRCKYCEHYGICFNRDKELE